MELPPYRLPTLKASVRHMWFKGSQYLQKMGGIILIASVIIWALGYFPRNEEIEQAFDRKIDDTNRSYQLALIDKGYNYDEILLLEVEKDAEILRLSNEKVTELQTNSFIGKIGRFIQPVMEPLGFDWRMSVSLVAGVMAKEIVVSTLGVLYKNEGGTNQENSEPLQQKLQNATYKEGSKIGNKVFTPITAFSYLMFILLYFPCVAVVAAVKKESGNWKWALFMVSYTTITAWVVAFLVNYIGGVWFG
jgi:ferrous iron transport protein B